jgi:RND family efflux transporter MFP subunit
METVPTAPVAVVTHEVLTNQLHVAGEFLPYQEVELHAKVSGYIRRIYIDIGDRVHNGQLLAELEVPELTAQVTGAQAGILRSKEEIQRARSAIDRAEADHAALHAAAARLQSAAKTNPGLIAQQELDDAQAKDSSSRAQVEAAKSELSAMQQTLNAAHAEHQRYASLASYARLTAPFAGIVTWRYADTGALLQSGTSNASSMPAVKLAEVDKLRLRLPVSESLASLIRVGSQAQMRVQGTGQNLTGTVVRTTGELDLTTRTMQVEIDVDNKDGKLSPGMYADVSLELQRSGDGLTVPITAVDRSQAAPFVLVVNSSGKVEKRTVALGLETADRIEILNGLRDGEKVISTNLSSYRPGEPVTPLLVKTTVSAANAATHED